MRITREAAHAADAVADALGISRDAYLEVLLLREYEKRDERGRPKWWSRRTAPAWWVDPEQRTPERSRVQSARAHREPPPAA